MVSRPTTRVKVQPRPRVTVGTIPKFPAQVVAGDGIAIEQSGGVFTFALDLADYTGVVTGPPASNHNAVARFAGTSGSVLQSSNAFVSDTGHLTLPASGLTIGSSTPFSDSAGVLTFQNVDIVDHATRSAIFAPYAHYFQCLDDDGATDQSASIQAQIDDCEAAGICEAVFPPYLIWAEGLVISHPLKLRGTGIKVFKGNADEGLPSDFGTRLLAKVGTEHCIDIPAGANGAGVYGISFLQKHDPDAPGWVPTTYAATIRNTSAWTEIAGNNFWGGYDGILLGDGADFDVPGSAYVTIRNNSFACYRKAVHIYKAGDWNLAEGNWFHNDFVGDLTSQTAYIQANASMFYIGRSDALMLIGNGGFGHKYGIETYINPDAPSQAEGISERLKIVNLDIDKVRRGILLVKGCTGHGANIAIVGDNSAGTFAIQGNQSVKFKFVNVDTINHGVSAIYAAETGCVLSFTNLKITNANLDGANPAMSAASGATIIRSGEFEAAGSYSVIEGGSGTYHSGQGNFLDSAFSLADNGDPTKKGALQLSGLTTGTTRTWTMPDGDFTFVGTTLPQTLTNKTLTAPTISGGGSLAGIFSSNPTFSGTVTFSGTPVFQTGASLAGTFSGTPTFSGANFISLANIAQGSALSVLGVAGNATANHADIAASSDHQVMRRSGAAIGFGAVNLAQSAAVSGTLTGPNGGTGTDISTAWSTSSPAVSAPGATGFSATAALRSRTIGKTYEFNITVTVANAGSGGAQIDVAMPITSTSFAAAASYDATSNASLISRMSASGTTLTVLTAAGGYPGVSGHSLVVTGVIEIN